jgi:hypothetical protein
MGNILQKAIHVPEYVPVAGRDLIEKVKKFFFFHPRKKIFHVSY